MCVPEELKEDASTEACGERVNRTPPPQQFLTQICSAEDPTRMVPYRVQQSGHGHTWDKCRTANVFRSDSYSSPHPYTAHFNVDAFRTLDLEVKASGRHMDTDCGFPLPTAPSKIQYLQVIINLVLNIIKIY